MTDESTGALTEQDREDYLLNYVAGQAIAANGDKEKSRQELRAYVARHVAEAQANFLAARELSNRFMMDMETWKERAEKAEAALAEAEKKGAREAWKRVRAVLESTEWYCDDEHDWLGKQHLCARLDRAAQTGGESDV